MNRMVQTSGHYEEIVNLGAQRAGRESHGCSIGKNGADTLKAFDHRRYHRLPRNWHPRPRSSHLIKKEAQITLGLENICRQQTLFRVPEGTMAIGTHSARVLKDISSCFLRWWKHFGRCHAIHFHPIRT